MKVSHNIEHLDNVRPDRIQMFFNNHLEEHQALVETQIKSKKEYEEERSNMWKIKLIEQKR